MSDTEIRPSQVVGQLLVGQTVVVIGGSSGIGLETARLARTEGADVVITGRDHVRLEEAANDVGATSVAAFDATDFERLAGFFDELPAPIDHVLVTGPGPYYVPLSDFDVDAARRDLEAHLLLPIQVTRDAVRQGSRGRDAAVHGGHRWSCDQCRVQPHLGAHGRRPRDGQELGAQVAPVRVNMIAAGFVDTPLSASLLADRIDERRDELRRTLPIGRVVGPADIALLAVQLMTNTAVTGATFDIDGGQQLVG